MNQHDDNPGEQHDEAVSAGAAPVSGGAPEQAQQGHAEYYERPWQRDVAEHEASVPSSVENGSVEGQPDVAEHEAAVPSSDGDAAETAEAPAAAVQSTGDDRVDEALSRLAELDRLDATEHAGVVEDVHRALQDTLAEEED